MDVDRHLTNMYLISAPSKAGAAMGRRVLILMAKFTALGRNDPVMFDPTTKCLVF